MDTIDLFKRGRVGERSHLPGKLWRSQALENTGLKNAEWNKDGFQGRLEGWWSFTWMMWFRLSVYPIADGSMGLEHSLQSTCKWISPHLSYVIKALNCWHKEDNRSEAVGHEAPSPKTKGSKQPLHLKEEAVKCQVKLSEAVGYAGEAEYVYRHMLQ